MSPDFCCYNFDMRPLCSICTFAVAGMSFPNKEDRKKCWDSRDRYWQCLDGNKDEQELCQKQRKAYESSCPMQWVSALTSSREVTVNLVWNGDNLDLKFPDNLALIHRTILNVCAHLLPFSLTVTSRLLFCSCLLPVFSFFHTRLPPLSPPNLRTLTSSLLAITVPKHSVIPTTSL